MASALDRAFDAKLAEATGPGGKVVLGRDKMGRAIITNLPDTLPGLFAAFCALHHESLAVVAGTERLTFGDLDVAADNAARALVARHGIAKGDRVAIAMRNAPAWIVSYMAVLKAGGIAALVNGWWQPDEFRHGVELVEPKLVICDAPRGERLAATGLDVARFILPIERPLAEAMAPLGGGNDATVLPEVTGEDFATILFTSGSTGLSKGACSTHRAVTTGTYAFTMNIMALLSIMESEGRPPVNPPRTLVNVPLFHVTGEVPVLLNSFVIGRAMVLMAKWDAGEALRLIEAEKVTYFVGVPTMSLELMQHPDREKRDLSSLTDIAAGGAARPTAHVERLRKSFGLAQPALGYGLTETNAAGCSNFWENYVAKPASTGRPHVPLVEMAILGDDGRHLPRGESGEIAIRSASNFSCYWNDPAATRAAFTQDQYLKTGDIGYLDDEDYLFIVDRKKDIIIRGGENIACQEVEAACYSAPEVHEACVFGVPDERLGEAVAAVIHAGPGFGAERLCAFLSGRISDYKRPQHVWFHPEPLPKLGTGKIDKVALRAKYRSALSGG